MKKKSLLLVLCLLLATTMTLGGTLAYLTDRDANTNVFTVGNVDIDLTEDFEQGAELLPGVNVEKKPTIVNEGTTDAWVWMTISLPKGLDQLIQGTEQGSNENPLHWNPTGATTEGYVNQTRVDKAIADGILEEGITAEEILAENKTWNVFNSLGERQNCYEEEINGKTVNTYVFLYNKALTPGEETLPSLYNVFLDSRIDIDPEGNMFFVENGNATALDWNVNEDGNPTIYVAAYGIQKEGFDTVDEAYAAYGTQWGENGGVDFSEVTPVEVGTDAELKAALAANEQVVYVKLTADVTYDVVARQGDAMGGDETDTVVIDGNGHTLTFNQTNSDWNDISTANGAELVLKNMDVTNSGHNDGPWNRHDLNFACDVTLKNVNSDKAMAFHGDATLEDVTISDANTSDTYAMWIQPQGQKVTLNNVTIDMLDCTDGRGIKIDNQYMAAADESKVTLIVKNTTIKTEEKSAILVKTTAGAAITLDKVDISAVAADSTNPVWVDKATADYADLVTVTGGSKIVEP